MGINAKYLHSDIDTLERMSIIHSLRKGEFDVLVGINLLREGSDIPEAFMVAILVADKEGFLRSRGSLIQAFGSAARHSAGQVILYADKMTGSMTEAISETERRRAKQLAFNEEHGITPRTILKDVETPFDNLFSQQESGAAKRGRKLKAAEQDVEMQSNASPKELGKIIQRLEREMREAAKELEFERAAGIRDRITFLRQKLILSGSEEVA